MSKYNLIFTPNKIRPIFLCFFLSILYDISESTEPPTPVLKIDDKEENIQNFQWNLNNQYYQPSTTNQNLDIIFDDKTNTIFDSATSSIKTNANKFEIFSQEIGLKIGTLKVNFESNQNKNFILDLSNVDTANAFSGNIEVTGTDATNIFAGVFSKSIDGNITLDSSGMHYLTFKNGANLQNLILNQGNSSIQIIGESNITSLQVKGGNNAITLNNNAILQTNLQTDINSNLTITIGSKTQLKSTTSSLDFNGTTNLTFFNNSSLQSSKINNNGTMTLTFDGLSTLNADINNTNTAILNLNLRKNSTAIINGEVTNITQVKLENQSQLFLQSNNITIETLENNANSILSLADNTQKSREFFRTLNINNLQNNDGKIIFTLYVNPQASATYADKIIIKEDNTKNTQYILPILDPNTDISKISFNDKKVLLATTKNTNIEFQKGYFGAELIEFQKQTQKTTEDGTMNSNGEYTSYYLSSIKISEKISQNIIDINATTLSANYMLYVANLNTLNKRLGELRENPHSQGAWARIFNGMQTSNFALKANTIYTTFQAGYDYAFGFNGANNYLGFALSYAKSILINKDVFIEKSITGMSYTRGIEKLNSNAIEFAIYNAYVQDGANKNNRFSNGLYTDTILKFSYIRSDFSLMDSQQTNTSSNLAITLTQELGYRYLFGNKHQWGISPMIQANIGIFNQGSFKQYYNISSYTNNIQNLIMTLRGKIGALYDYDFKTLIKNQSFGAKIYMGTYFVGDSISGGEVNIITNNTNSANVFFTNTSRIALNLGANFKLKDYLKIYFDFERSFGGKIITDYQINLGIRYAFGTSKYTPFNLALDSQDLVKENNLQGEE